MSLVAAIALAASAAAAATETGTVDITWTAPADCPTASDLDASIRTLLGRAPRLADGRHLDVKARAEPKRDHAWTATIETRLGTAAGSRTLAAESCRAAADATALIVALMIDPQAVALHATPPPPPAGGVARATRAPPPETDAVASGASIGLPHSALVTALSLGPSVIVDAGTLPRLTYGAGARVGVRFGASALELGVLASAAERAAIAATTPPVGGSFRFRSASLSACPAASRGRFELGACAVVELTQVNGTGFGVSSSFDNDARWLAVGGGALARLRLGRRFAIPLRIDLMAPLARPTFVLLRVPEARGEVYRPSRVVMRGSLALDVVF
jgi:hypothetical protein